MTNKSQKLETFKIWKKGGVQKRMNVCDCTFMANKTDSRRFALPDGQYLYF